MKNKRWWKRLAAALCALAVLCGAAVPASSADGAALRLDVSGPAVFADEHICVTLSLTGDLPDVGSLELHLLYDADALQPQTLTAGSANDALRVIYPSAQRQYTGVLFVYDYGTDGTADKSFRAGTLLTAVFAVKDGASAQSLTFSVQCAAAQDTQFRPLSLPAADSITVPLFAQRPAVSILRASSVRTVLWHTTLTLTAEAAHPVAGGEIVWVVNDRDAERGETLVLRRMQSDAAVRAEYRLNGGTLAVSDTQSVHVRTDFFARIAAFFRDLFGKSTLIQSL